jgi:hypothetical protein
MTKGDVAGAADIIEVVARAEDVLLPVEEMMDVTGVPANVELVLEVGPLIGPMSPLDMLPRETDVRLRLVEDPPMDSILLLAVLVDDPELRNEFEEVEVALNEVGTPFEV